MRYIFLIIFTLCCLLPVGAQNAARKDSLVNRELTLEREYNPTIQDAIKLSHFPELREPQAPKTTVEFSNYEIPFQVQSKLFPLSPQAYLTKLNYSKYKGYLTGGISSLIDIDGDIGYQILNSDRDQLNIFFSHRSSGCNISYLQDELLENDTRKFKINDNWGGLNFLHNFGKLIFNADVKYTYSAFNYYGLSIPLVINFFEYYFWNPAPNNNFDKNTNQVNNMFETHIGISSDKASLFNYKLNLGYTNFQQKYGNLTNESGSRENRILIDGDIHQLVNSSMGLGLSGIVKSNFYSNSFKILNDSTTNYWTYSVKPYIYWEDYNFNLLLGIKMDVEVGGRGKIIASPAIRLNYYPSDRVMLYLLTDGGIKDNSQYNLFYENRYIDPLIRVMDSRSPLDATAGIKFTPLPVMSVDIFGGFKIIRDEHFVFPNVGSKYNFDDSPVLAGNWITPLYEDANTFKLGADFKYSFQDIFELNLKGTFYNWTISEKKKSENTFLHKAWNKPDFEMNLNTAYRLQMIPLRFDLSYLGAYGRKTTDSYLLSTIVKMKDIHDLSLKGTYSFTPNFSAYLSFNNLLFSKYDIWWGFPAQGFNIMGGLSFLF